MNEPPNKTSRTWTQEPFMWLVVGIPVLTVIAGVSTVVIASRHKDTLVSDEFRKEGLAIQHDPARDLAAARIGAEATVSIAADRLTVTLKLAAAEAPGTLVALLSHATRAELDQLVVLSPEGDGHYVATLPHLPSGHWYLEISPRDRSWRLRGDFSDMPTTLELVPGSAS